MTRQEHLVKELIWASLLSLLLKRFIGRLEQMRLKRRLSLLILAKSIQASAAVFGCQSLQTIAG